MLILFLHSCYYDVAKTKSCIESYYEFRRAAPELFINRNLEYPENEKQLSILYYLQFPVKDPDGNHIVLHGLKYDDASQYCFQDAARIYMMMLDRCIQHEGTTSGLVIIFDAKRIKFKHLSKLNFSLMRKILAYAQEGMPVRLKGIHVLNVAPVIDYLMRLMRPFLGKEIISLIHFHKGSNETIFEYLPKKCLPQDYGGDLPSLGELEATYIHQLKQYHDHFTKEEKL